MGDQLLAASPPKLLDRVRAAVRTRHLASSTEKAYVHWAKRYILFHRKRHPTEMGEQEVNAFLTHLAVSERVAASTQNQALAGLLFLYDKVLGRPLNDLAGVVRACGSSKHSGCESRMSISQKPS